MNVKKEKKIPICDEQKVLCGSKIMEYFLKFDVEVQRSCNEVTISFGKTNFTVEILGKITNAFT